MIEEQVMNEISHVQNKVTARENPMMFLIPMPTAIIATESTKKICIGKYFFSATRKYDRVGIYCIFHFNLY